MAKTYPLRILTPERLFFEGDALCITVESIAGRLSVLKEHIPMVTALTVGSCTIRTPEKETYAFHSEGFMEVAPEGVTVICQAAEWPEEIDEARARRAAARASARLEETGKDAFSKTCSKLALARARARLDVYERHTL